MRGCEYCSDLRNIEPAKNIFVGNKQGELNTWLKEARDKKQFLEAVYKDGKLYAFKIVESCPKCGYQFTEEDYDNS